MITFNTTTTTTTTKPLMKTICLKINDDHLSYANLSFSQQHELIAYVTLFILSIGLIIIITLLILIFFTMKTQKDKKIDSSHHNQLKHKPNLNHHTSTEPDQVYYACTSLDYSAMDVPEQQMVATFPFQYSPQSRFTS